MPGEGIGIANAILATAPPERNPESPVIRKNWISLFSRRLPWPSKYRPTTTEPHKNTLDSQDLSGDNRHQ